MRKIRKSNFTLLEVMVSMGVFTLLMLALMQFFSVAQGLWEKSGKKAEVYDTARVAMELLVNDLSCAFYENDHDATKFQFFECSGTNASATPPATKKLIFAAQKPEGMAEIIYQWDKDKYALYRKEKKEADADVINGPWFTRGFTPSASPDNKHWIDDITVDRTTDLLAENVVDFSVETYKRAPKDKGGFTETETTNKVNRRSPPGDADARFPDVVIVKMTVISQRTLDFLRARTNIPTATDDASMINAYLTNNDKGKQVMQKLLQLDNNTITDFADDSLEAAVFNGCQTFQRTILLDRGRY